TRISTLQAFPPQTGICPLFYSWPNQRLTKLAMAYFEHKYSWWSKCRPQMGLNIFQTFAGAQAYPSANFCPIAPIRPLYQLFVAPTYRNSRLPPELSLSQC